MKVSCPVPVLRTFSEEKAKEFYIDFLGFSVDWEHRFEEQAPLYMQISKGECIIHLSEHHGDCSPGASLRIEVDKLDEYQQVLNGKKYCNARPGIVTQPWGTDMTIADPFGNKVIFSCLRNS